MRRYWSIDIQKIDKEAIDKQLIRLASFKSKRDRKLVEDALERLDNAIANDSNLMPHIVKCAESNVTLGEISDALRKRFGDYQG